EVTFGPFRLAIGRRQLCREGRLVPLGSRSLDILCALVSAGGGLVSKDELMERIWPGTIVEENTLHFHISALRKAIGSGPDWQSFIVTMPGRGYRFVGAQAPLIVDAHLNGVQEDLRLPDKPSIAVLPFNNLSGNHEQEYFADGMVEEIITALSRI